MTAKTARPDRKKGNRRQKAPSEFEETTLTIDRVTRVVAGGRRMRFRAVVVVGDKKGRVGVGTGKSAEVQGAVQKATAVAKRNMIRVPIVNGTIPHEIDHKFKASRIRLLPARDGTGIIAGGALRTVLEHAGIQNVLSKRYGTNNKLVNAQCIIKALQTFRGVEVGPLNPEPVKKAEAEELPENINITEVSKKDVSRDGNLNKKK
jgi:small subunit ribosomal protein S5